VIAAIGEMESAGLIELREIPQSGEICITFRYGKTCFKTTQWSSDAPIVEGRPLILQNPTDDAPTRVTSMTVNVPQVIAPDDLGPELPDFGPQPSDSDPT